MEKRFIAGNYWKVLLVQRDNTLLVFFTKINPEEPGRQTGLVRWLHSLYAVFCDASIFAETREEKAHDTCAFVSLDVLSFLSIPFPQIQKIKGI